MVFMPSCVIVLSSLLFFLLSINYFPFVVVAYVQSLAAVNAIASDTFNFANDLAHDVLAAIGIANFVNSIQQLFQVKLRSQTSSESTF